MVADSDGDIALGLGSRTQAAAEDIATGTRDTDIAGDIDIDGTLDITVDIGAAIDTCGVVATVVADNIDFHLAVVDSGDGCGANLSLAAAEDITVEGSTKEIDGGLLIEGVVDASEAGTAIDVAPNGGARGLVADGDGDIVSGFGVLSIAAAEDAFRQRHSADAQCAALDIDIDGTVHGTFRIAAAIDAGGHLALAHGDLCGAGDSCCIAAAEEVFLYPAIR